MPADQWRTQRIASCLRQRLGEQMRRAQAFDHDHLAELADWPKHSTWCSKTEKAE